VRTRSITRSIAAATTVVALAAAGALLVPAAASADQSDINTTTFQWSGVDDTTGYIDDAATYDLANDAYGWNDDALDGLPDPFTLRDTSQGSWDFVASTSVSDIHQGGTSVITMTGTTTGWTDPYTVVLTLTLEGNYAHWAYRLSNPTIGLANSSVAFTGNIGSDRNTEYAVNGNTLVSDDTSPANGSDPIIGYNVVTNGTFGGWATSAGNDNPEATATAAGSFDVYLVLFGYTPCANGFADAKTAVTALVPTLPATFGDRYNDAGACITVAPLSLTTGVPVDQVLTYTVDPALTSESYFTSEAGVSSVVEDLPAGLTATSVKQPDGSFVVTISGTPMTAGKFTARLLFAQGSEPARSQVLGSTVITIADPAVVAVAAVPELAATGVDATGPIGLAGFLLLAGLGMAAVARRRLV
jgi:hypothetical protein